MQSPEKITLFLIILLHKKPSVRKSLQMTVILNELFLFKTVLLQTNLFMAFDLWLFQ